MTAGEKTEKRNWFLFMIGYFTAGYLVINWISSQRTLFYDLSTGLDRAIPFLSPFIFGYILVYLSILIIYLIIKDMDDWYRVIVSFLVATTLAYAIFLVFPVHMDLRPDLRSSAGTCAIVTRLYYVIDMPYNCFPSLHVTYPTLATLVAWRRHHFVRYFFAATTIIVAVSVILVKQHYIADVFGGFINAGLCFWLTVKFEKSWSKCFAHTSDKNSNPSILLNEQS